MFLGNGYNERLNKKSDINIYAIGCNSEINLDICY